jgi:integral membrane sensor domain MASE1
VFALDVFSEGYGFLKTLFALMMHLIPTAIVLGVLALAWRWEWIGAVGFGSAGLLYAKMAWGHPSWILAISGPLFVLAALFLVSWLKRAGRGERHSPGATAGEQVK